jgi:hypothetical protein
MRYAVQNVIKVRSRDQEGAAELLLGGVMGRNLT